MFGKKKSDDSPASDTAKNAGKAAPEKNADTEAPSEAPPLKPFSRKGSHAPPKPPTATSFQPEIQRRIPDIPKPSGRRMERPVSGVGAIGNDGDSKCLVVGREISLKGEITACDKLVVEGVVEVTLPNAHAIEVSPSGRFTGNADVAEADISGSFDGELMARERLIVRAGGHVKGKVRYGRIVIEAGGEVSGDMQTLEDVDN